MRQPCLEHFQAAMTSVLVPKINVPQTRQCGQGLGSYCKYQPARASYFCACDSLGTDTGHLLPSLLLSLHPFPGSLGLDVPCLLIHVSRDPMKDLISNSKLDSEEVLAVSREGTIHIFFGFIAKPQRLEKSRMLSVCPSYVLGTVLAFPCQSSITFLQSEAIGLTPLYI